MDIFSVTKNLLAVVGAITTLVAIYELYKKLISLREEKKEFLRKVGLLKSANYFIAHIIHLGGEFSMTHSLQVFSDEDGGYYFNPPKDFVGVSFNRGGDLTIIMPTELSRKFGFVIDSVAGSNRKFKKTTYADICHLPQSSIKNEHFVKFVKSKND